MNPEPTATRQRFRNGNAIQLFWFAVAIGYYALGVGLFVHQKLDSIGQPDVGWNLDWHQVSPTREDTAG